MMRAVGLISFAAGICIAGLATAAPPAPPETFTINLSPTFKVGQHYHLTAKMVDAQDEVMWTTGARSPSKTETTYEMDGIVDVRAIDSHGAGTWLGCKVNYIRMSEGGNTVDIVPPGCIVSSKTVPLGANYKVWIDCNVKIDDGQREQIQKIFESAMPEAPTEQEMFGTATPQPIGGSWALNRQRGVAYLAHLFIGVEPRDFTGKSQFVGPVKVGDIDCFQVDGTAKAAKYVSIYDTTIKTLHAAYSMKFSKVVARDPKKLFQKTTIESHNDFEERGMAGGGGFRREMVEDIKRETTIEPVQKK